MNCTRILKRSVLPAAVAAVLGASVPAMTTTASQAQTPPARAMSASPLLAAAARMQAAPLPPACQEMIFKTGEKFPTVRYAIPDEPWNAAIAALGNLTEAEQAELTEPACAAWNSWARGNSAAVTADLDNRYRNAALPVCNKFTVATLGTIKKYAPSVPAATRRLETVAKKVWTEAMTKLSTTALDPACRTYYNNAKASW